MCQYYHHVTVPLHYQFQQNLKSIQLHFLFIFFADYQWVQLQIECKLLLLEEQLPCSIRFKFEEIIIIVILLYRVQYLKMKIVIDNEGEIINYQGPLQYTAIIEILSDQQKISSFNLQINKGNGIQICKITNQQELENNLNYNIAQTIKITLKQQIQNNELEEEQQEQQKIQENMELDQQKRNKFQQQQLQHSFPQQTQQQEFLKQETQQKSNQQQQKNKQPKKSKKLTVKEKRSSDIKKTYNKMAKLMQNHIDKLVKKKIKAMIPSIKEQIIMQLQQKKYQEVETIPNQQTKQQQQVNVLQQTQRGQQIKQKTNMFEQKVQQQSQKQIKDKNKNDQVNIEQQTTENLQQKQQKKIPKPDNKTQFFNQLQKLIKLIYQGQRQQQQQEAALRKQKRQQKINQVVKKHLQREKEKNLAREKEKIQQRCLKLSKIYCTDPSFFTSYVQSTLQLPLKQMIEHYALTQQSSIPQLSEKMFMKKQQKYKRLCHYFNKFKPQYHQIVEKYPDLSINKLVDILCQNGVEAYNEQVYGLLKNEQLANKSNINKKMLKQVGKEQSWVQLQCKYNQKSTK